MKKLILIACLLILAGCKQGNIASISLEDKVPRKVGEHMLITNDKPLQIFSNGTKTYYIVYQSNNEINQVPSITEDANKVLTINVSEGDPLDSPKTYIFKLSMTEATDSIDLTINGKSRPFDEFVIYD